MLKDTQSRLRVMQIPGKAAERVLREEQGDGADAAVQIPYCLIPLQIRILERQLIETARLPRYTEPPAGYADTGESGGAVSAEQDTKVPADRAEVTTYRLASFCLNINTEKTTAAPKTFAVSAVSPWLLSFHRSTAHSSF